MSLKEFTSTEFKVDMSDSESFLYVLKWALPICLLLLCPPIYYGKTELLIPGAVLTFIFLVWAINRLQTKRYFSYLRTITTAEIDAEIVAKKLSRMTLSKIKNYRQQLSQ